MRLLDLFCGAGGAAVGYNRAGFDEIVGVDIEPQPNYPFKFLQMDVFEAAELLNLQKFDMIHASPPCQAYTLLGSKDGRHEKLIEPVRQLLIDSGIAYVIENVETAKAHLIDPVRLCGSAFGLHVRRHRMFESTFDITPSICQHKEQGDIRAYYGKKGWAAWTPKGAQVQKAGRKPLLRGTVEQAKDDMGIDWMTWDELRESIPPAYTEHIGKAFLELKVAA
jgi:DNA (cytosine-5)-methyltransferase 1